MLTYACFGVWTYVVQATQPSTGKNVSVGQNQVVADDLILAGQKVNVQCEAKQDLIVAGDEVTITGPINGYILAAGNHLMLSGLHCPGVIFRSTVVDGRIGVVVGRRLVV